MGMSSKQVSISDHLELNWTHQNITSSSSDQTIIVQSPSSNPHHRSSTNMKQRSSLQTTQQQQPAAENLKCPRCDSSNTKFCYYNNYNKTQPRHYCKACKRHWTKGGTLRNVPVGGGRKNKRSKRPPATPHTTSNLGTSHDHHQKYIFPTITQEAEYKGAAGLLFKPANGSEFDHQVSTWDFNGGFASSMQQQQSSSHNNQNLGFSIHSSLTSMDTNTTIIPTSAACYSPLLSAAGFKDHDSSTTVTTTRMMTPPNSSNVLSSSQPWPMQLVPTPSNILEPNNFWTWNDIDYMVQGDHINKPFEDPHMKH